MTNLKKLNLNKCEKISLNEVMDIFKKVYPCQYKATSERMEHFKGKEKDFILRVLEASVSESTLFYTLYSKMNREVIQIIQDDNFIDSEKINQLKQKLIVY